MKLNREEYSWTDAPIVGMALLITGGSVGSFGDKIKVNVYYEVGKRKSDGIVAILPTERNQKHEFVNAPITIAPGNAFEFICYEGEDGTFRFG